MTQLSVPGVADRLEADAGVFAALVERVGAEQARWKPEPAKWSILEVMCHVADEEVEDFLGEIFARISAHFALEERAMVARNYPEYWPHKGDHERLLDQLRDIMEGYESTHTLDSGELSQKLDDWFSVHFRTFDARFHHFVH